MPEATSKAWRVPLLGELFGTSAFSKPLDGDEYILPYSVSLRTSEERTGPGKPPQGATHSIDVNR